MRFLWLLLSLCICFGCKSSPAPALESPTPSPATSVSPTPRIEFTPDPELVSRLRSHVRTLAEEIGPRNLHYLGQYRQAESYLSETLSGFGYQVERHNFWCGEEEVTNLIATREGNEPGTLVVGAHYDTAGSTPGADDNASGCAALLELARRLKASSDGPSVRFVLFANEEPEHFQTETMGSLVYAKRCQSRGEKLVGMLSLETVGYYSDEPDSQHFPVGISGYPTVGNFVGFVSDLSSKPLMEKCLKSFKSAGVLPAEGLAAPSFLEGIGWSDHWSFWQAGYQAVMITDTAPFRNPNYHQDTDTLDTLDFDRLAAVVVGVEAVILGF